MKTNEELVLEYQAGNKAVLEQLYLQNSGLIEKIIRRYSGVEELEDLRQESFFGLMMAATLWKPEKEAAFISYAVYWIKAAISRYIDQCSGVVRIPSYKRVLIGRYHRAVNAYRLRFGRYPSKPELCAVLDITPEQLEELKKDVQAARIRSTSELIGGEDEELTLEDTLPAEGDQISDVIESMQREQLFSELWTCVNELKPQQAGCIRGLYKDGKTLEECGAGLGVSIERTRQIREEAFRELRRPHYSKRLLPYLDEGTAHRWSLSGTGFGTFNRYGSVQERAMMRLEEFSSMSLYNGAKFPSFDSYAAK